MAVTQNTYTGNGSTVLYNFTFPYLQETDVQVKLDGATQATSTYTFANATTIQFNSAPGNGVRIIIFRNTDNDNKKATFYPGSAIKAEDLNDNIDQILYVAQEVDNNAMSSLGDTQMQGDLEFGQGMGLIFEGSTTDANETRLAVLDPTADRAINLPDVSGTVVTTGDTGSITSTMILDGTIVSGDIADGTIVNADINASAAIAGTKIDPSFGTQNLSLTGNISVSGTVDGRDVSTDGSKLDGIESGATADQTAAEIRTLVESATDSNVFTDADHTKLNNIETAATADQTASEIKSLYESNSDTNNFTDAEKTFLSDVTATATEINYTTNVTSDIQSQIDGKQPLDSELTTLAGMQTQTASQLASSTALSATTTNLNITQGMTKATSLTTDSDTEFPTSKAVNDRILTVTNALGGFVAIADKDNFPTSHPDPSGNAGTVVSISNASGISVNSSGVGTLATRAGGSDAVIINGFPSALRGGATVDGQPNANPFVLPANVGLQVQTTGTAHTYDYHKYFINEEEANKLSGSIQSFQERYRVAASAPTSNNDDGDLYFDTTANKMKVYNASSSSWDDVATPGNFLLNTISSSSGSGGGSATFNGTATRFTLSNPPDQYAQQLLVSINGVIQKPNSGTSPSEGFAIDGNDIIFASAPASGSDYFIVTQGSSVNIGTPSNNTVSTATIQSGAITNDKVSASAAIAKSKLASLDIVNADVNASAAIAGTKISPDFGSQNISTTGNIGIGTESPSNNLHLGASGADAKRSIKIDGTNGSSELQGVILESDGENSRFNIKTASGGGTPSDKLTIATATGNVGIGTTSPGQKLGVSGNIRFEAADPTLEFNNGGAMVYARAANTLQFASGGGPSSPQEKLRIDSNGNLLHGVSAVEDTTNNSGTKLITTGDLQIDGDQKALVFRSTASTAQKQSGIQWWNENGAGVQSAIYSIRTAVSNAPGALAFYTSANVDTTANSGQGDITERMRIDEHGRLFLGTTNTVLGSSGVFGEFCIREGTEGAALHLADNDANVHAGFFTSDNSNFFVIRTITNHPMTFRTNNTERMRITNNGYLWIGCTTEPNHNVAGIQLADTSAGAKFSCGGATTTQNHIIFFNGNGIVGSIQTSGSATSFNTSSDYRLKENEVAISDGITRLKTLKPYRFNFKIHHLKF